MSKKEQEIKHIGLIGFPVGHSLSPLMQQAAFDHSGIAGRYELWETPPGELEARIADLRWPEYRGANLTVPYKEDVLPLLDSINAEAAQIGAVNVVVNQAGSLIGYNTDAPGFLRALRDDADFDPAGCRALLLGAGGAGRAVAYALARAGVSDLVIANRTLDRAELLAARLANLAPLPASAPTYPDEDGTDADPIEYGDGFNPALPLSEELQTAAAHARHPMNVTVLALDDLPEYLASHSYDLLVNATAVGLSPMHYDACPLDPQLIRPDSVVFDLLYQPTRLQREARTHGARYIDGLAMLVYQGALSFELWTGQPAPLEVMFAAARKQQLDVSAPLHRRSCPGRVAQRHHLPPAPPRAYPSAGRPAVCPYGGAGRTTVRPYRGAGRTTVRPYRTWPTTGGASAGRTTVRPYDSNLKPQTSNLDLALYPQR